MSGVKQPSLGAVYESLCLLSTDGTPRQWTIVAGFDHGAYDWENMWELAPAGGNQSRRNVQRTTQELTDPEMWRQIDQPSSTKGES